MILHRTLSPQLLISSLAVCVVMAPLAEVQASPYRHPLPSLLSDDMEGADEADGLDEESEVDEGDEVDGDPEEEVDGGDVASGESASEGPQEAPPPQPEPKKGLGMMISGAVITGAYALPLSIYGTSIIVASRRIADSEDPLDQAGGALGGALGGVILGFGLVGLAVGAPLLGVGASRFSRWRKWKANNNVALAPSVGRTAFGTYTPGITMRF